MAKRYYWLKLKEDFFEEDTLEWLEEQENGKEYCLFYLKLCLKSLRTNGVLIRNVGNMLVPYDIKKLAELTNTDFDTAVVAMELFKRIGLVDVLDNGEIFMTQLQEMVGSETDKAIMMRKKRALEKQDGNNVTEALPNCYTEKEKEIDIEKEIEIDKEIKKKKKPASQKEPKHKYGQFKNVLLTDKELAGLREKYGDSLAGKAINFLDAYIEEKGYKSRSHNLAIQRWVIEAVKEKQKKSSYGNNSSNVFMDLVKDEAEKPEVIDMDKIDLSDF